MTSKWKASYREIKEKHDEAYHTLQDACREDVNENLEVVSIITFFNLIY